MSDGLRSRSLVRSSKDPRLLVDNGVRGVLFTCGIVAIVAIFFILIFLLQGGISVITNGHVNPAEPIDDNTEGVVLGTTGDFKGIDDKVTYIVRISETQDPNVYLWGLDRNDNKILEDSEIQGSGEAVRDFHELEKGLIIRFNASKGGTVGDSWYIEAYDAPSVWEFVTGEIWKPTKEPPLYGAYPLIMGTLIVTLGAIIISVPLGIGCAIFISELATPKVRTLMKSSVEILAGIPSIVYGLFGMLVLCDWLRVTFDVPSGRSWLAGSIILGIMALPTIVSVSEDAITSVPREFKEASYGIGATKWQTIRNVVLPASLSGITAGVILGIGRAIGETMAVIMVTGNTAIMPVLTDPFSTVKTLTGAIGIEMGEAPPEHQSALFFLGVILFVIVLVVNFVANYILDRVKEKFNPTEKKRLINIKMPPVVKFYAGRVFFFITAIFAIWLFSKWFGMETALMFAVPIITIYMVNKFLPVTKQQMVAYGVLTGAMLLVLFLMGVIIYYIVANGMGVLSWEFITQPPSDLGREGGIGPAIVGTLYLVAGAIAIAVPLGIGAGIYLAEYAREGKITKVIRTGIDNLNATPSIVFGLFAMAFLVQYLELGISLLTGQIILGLLILPTMIRTTEEAIKSVPRNLREGSLAMGATKWETIKKVVLPPALPGIITGIIISIGRAAGESAPIWFTATTFMAMSYPDSLSRPVMALPMHIFYLTKEVHGAKDQAYGAALVLLIMIMIIYGIAIIIRMRSEKSKHW